MHNDICNEHSVIGAPDNGFAGSFPRKRGKSSVSLRVASAKVEHMGKSCEAGICIIIGMKSVGLACSTHSEVG